MQTQRTQKFDTGQNWEFLKIRDIIYLEKERGSARDILKKRTPPRV